MLDSTAIQHCNIIEIEADFKRNYKNLATFYILKQAKEHVAEKRMFLHKLAAEISQTKICGL
jgi:hypothetical protein